MVSSPLRLVVVACSVLAACKSSPPDRPNGSSGIVSGRAAPDSSPNAEGQRSAFAEQTRARRPSTFSRVKVETIAEGFDQPWGVEVLADVRFIVTERSGAMRVVGKAGRVHPPLAGVPKVVARGQGGLSTSRSNRARATR